jgi:hypothetical protein
MRRLVAGVALALAACAAPLERAQSFDEQLAYVEAGARAASKSITELTCLRWNVQAASCANPGQPLHPRKAVELMREIESVRKGLRAAAEMAPGGGQCVDKFVESPQACLSLVRELLRTVEQYVREHGGAK